MRGTDALRSGRSPRRIATVAALAAALAGSSLPAGSAPADVWSSPLALGPTDVASLSASDGTLLAAGRSFTVHVSPNGRKEAPSPRRAGLFRSADEGASWTLATERPEQEDTPQPWPPMPVPDLVEVAPGGETAYAIVGSAVWRSQDGGKTFGRVGSITGTMRTLDALPDGRLVGGLASGGLRVSSDGGSTWSSLGTGLPATAVNQVLFLGSTVFVATGTGLYRSTDGATTFSKPGAWVATSGNSVTFDAPALGVVGDSRHGIFVAVPEAGQTPYTSMTAIYWSPDLGATWSLRPPVSKNSLPRLTPGAFALAQRAAGRATASLHAGTVVGLHVSSVVVAAGSEEVSVPGLAWEQLGPEPGSASINAVTVADIDPSARRQDAVYAGVNRASIFLTGVGGERWATPGWFDVAEGARDCGGLDVQPGGRLFAACGRHLLASADGGATWNDPVGEDFPYVSAPFFTSNLILAHEGPEVSADGTVWINDWYAGLVRLPGGSGRWEKVPHPERGLTHLVAHPTDPDILYSGSIGNSFASVVWRTEDGGTTWTPVLTVGDWLQGIEVSKNVPDRVLALTLDDGARLSTDAGDTWSQVQSPTDGFNAAAFSEADPLVGYAIKGVSDGQTGIKWSLLRTRDGGNTWTISGDMPSSISPRLVASPWDVTTVYAQGTKGPIVTRDAGATWGSFASGLPEWDEGEIIEDLVASPDEPGVLYALAGVWRSVDPYAIWVFRAVDREVAGA